MITPKPWGVSTRRYIDPFVQLEQIKIHAGGYSSVHYHERKLNRFFVTEGALRVTFYDQNMRPAYSRVLEPGVEALAMPGQIHQFIAESDVRGYEVYFDPTGSLQAEDILRFSDNGVYVKLEAQYDSREPEAYCAICNGGIRGDEVVLFINGAMRPTCGNCSEALHKTGGPSASHFG